MIKNVKYVYYFFNRFLKQIIVFFTIKKQESKANKFY